VVVDTDVASAAIKGRLSGPIAAGLLGAAWCVTFVTVGELWQWAALRGWGEGSRRRLRTWLAGVVVLDSDEEVARAWGQVSAYARRRGRPRPVNDSWIAACCISWDLPLATFNTKDYTDFVQHEGLVLLDS
jgi:predicted nucleic acid-binding protein